MLKDTQEKGHRTGRYRVRAVPPTIHTEYHGPHHPVRETIRDTLPCSSTHGPPTGSVRPARYSKPPWLDGHPATTACRSVSAESAAEHAEMMVTTIDVEMSSWQRLEAAGVAGLSNSYSESES